MNPFLTIVTPTYNRREKLRALYQSLCRQTICADSFVWLIADDGSCDGTGEQVLGWQKEQDDRPDGFRIIYWFAENGGKHRALNRAVSEVETPLVFPVDSDDFLTEDAVESVHDAYVRELEDSEKKSDQKLCGFSFLRQRADGSLMSREASGNGVLSSFCEERINLRNQGDMAEVWVTDILKKFPFPEFPGEKFLGEDTVWIRMSGPYRMRFYNKVIYRSDYLEEGLTRNRRAHNLASPKGCTERARVFLESPYVTIAAKIKPAMQYWIYGHTAGDGYPELFARRPHGCTALLVLAFPPAVVLEKRWKRAYTA